MIHFKPNCTFPPAAPSGFVDGPNLRSTMDIVWSCACVVILSTWSVLHLTVPPDIKTRSKTQWIRKQMYLTRRKLGWMSLMLIFPEYLVGICTTNLFSSWINNPELQKLAEVDDVPWSLTHTILANMGGIAIRFLSEEHEATSQLERSRPSTPDDLIPVARSMCVAEGLGGEQWQLETNTAISSNRCAEKSDSESCGIPMQSGQCVPKYILDFQRKQARHLRGLGEIPWALYPHHLALAAGIRTETSALWRNIENYKARHIAPLSGNIWILDSKQLAIARTHGVIQRLPHIEENAIDDKSKSDGLIRLLAVIQVLWLAIQLISRRTAGIQFAALEISTVAFSSCAVLIYTAEWYKPKDVQVPLYMDSQAIVSPDIFSLIADAGPISFLQNRKYYMTQGAVHQVYEGRYQRKHIDRLMVLTSILSITLFGGIHLFAWNLTFPTRTEQLLWKTSALIVAIAPTISALLVLLESVLSHRTDRMSTWSVGILAPLYLSSRLFIIVESFRSLYFLPPGAFVATWSSNSPHVN